MKALFLTVLTSGLLIVGCSLTPDRAVWPQAWPAAGAVVETLAIERDGGWFSDDQDWRVGHYRVRPVPRSWWEGVPRSSGFSVGFGGGSGGVVVGVSTIHDESEFSFRLLAQQTDLAAVQCRQYLHVKDWQGGVGDIDFGSIIVEGNLAYLATLRCEAVGFHPDWPDQWRLDLRAVDLRPFFGVARVGDASWSVAGTQEGESGTYDASTGFEIGAGDSILARLNRIGERDLSMQSGLSSPQRMALLGVVGSLLLANDPLSP